MDIGDDTRATRLLPGYDYRSLDVAFANSLFSFIDDAFECLEYERWMGTAEAFRTETEIGLLKQTRMTAGSSRYSGPPMMLGQRRCGPRVRLIASRTGASG
jgi:hypothetical protein